MAHTLSAVTSGETFEIDGVADPDVRARLLRLGFLDGTVTCHRRIPNGPIVLQYKGTSLALGRRIADDITIVSPPDP